MYSINYTYPLTINSISLSDAGQYSCTARIHSNSITNVMDSDTIDQDSIVDVKCKHLICIILYIIEYNMIHVHYTYAYRSLIGPFL